MGNVLSSCFPEKNRAQSNGMSLRSAEIPMYESQKDDLWFKHFIKQAESLQKKHIWAKKLLPKLKKFKTSLTRQHYLASVLDLTQQNLFQGVEFDENRPKQQFSLYENSSLISGIPRKSEDGLALYKIVTSLIENHLKETKTHYLGYLLIEFVDSFYETYKQVLILEHQRGLERKSFVKAHKTSIENLQQFIRVFSETLTFFYDINKISNNGKLPAFSKENLLNFTTSLLFTHEKVYNIIFFIQKALDQPLEQKFQSIISLRDSFQITDFLIPNKLCIPLENTHISHKSKKLSNDLTFYSFSSDFEASNRTFCYQDNFKSPNEFESFHSFKEEDFYIERFTSFDDLNINTSKPSIQRTFSPLNSNSGDLHRSSRKESKASYHYKRKVINNEKTKEISIIMGKPYLDSIKLIEEIKEFKSPVDKMKRIAIMMSHIIKTINNLTDSGVESETLELKHLFCILLYVLIQSNCSDLHSQLKMVEKFNTNNVLNSINGYYFALLQVVVKFIGELDYEMMIGEVKKRYLKDRIEENTRDLARNLLF